MADPSVAPCTGMACTWQMSAADARQVFAAQFADPAHPPGLSDGASLTAYSIRAADGNMQPWFACADMLHQCWMQDLSLAGRVMLECFTAFGQSQFKNKYF